MPPLFFEFGNLKLPIVPSDRPEEYFFHFPSRFKLSFGINFRPLALIWTG
jgi:hypothetical protein